MKGLKRIFTFFSYAIGLGLIFNVPLSNYLIESYHPKIETLKSYAVPYSWDSVHLINLFSIIKARFVHPQIHVIGAIYNQQMDLNAPIALGVDDTIYSLCAGTLIPNEQMGKGNFILGAHNVHSSSKVLFSPLYRHGRIDDEVYVTDFKTVYTYKIIDIKSISQYDLSTLSQTKKPMLTLITCDKTDQKRIIFKGALISKNSFNRLSPTVKKYLSQKFEY